MTWWVVYDLVVSISETTDHVLLNDIMNSLWFGSNIRDWLNDMMSGIWVGKKLFETADRILLNNMMSGW